MKGAFTLIELLVTLAVLAIIVGAVFVTVNPGKRLADAADSKAKAEVISVAGAVERCLSFVNPATYVYLAIGDCDDRDSLVAGGFAKVVPANGSAPNFQMNANVNAVCISQRGGGTSYWKYYTVTQGSRAGGVVFEDALPCSEGW